MGPAVATSALTKSFRGVTALREVDLAVLPGELCGVVGADGAGKTTLLRCVAGLYRPDTGRVVPGRRGRSRVGFCPQGFHMYPDLTVAENVAFFATAYGLDAPTRRARGEELLEFAGLATHRNRLAGELSGGMQQKLTLVCSVLHRPPILLLDEPTTGVDPISRRDFWRLIEELYTAGTTIVLASSYFDEVERCQHVLFLHEGRVVADGSVDDLVGESQSLEAAFRTRLHEERVT